MSSYSYSQKIGTEILGSRDKMVIPFEYHGDLIIVEMHLHGILPQKYILDTGASNIIIFDVQKALLQGLKLNKRIKIQGADIENQMHAYISRDIGFRFAESPIFKRDIIILEKDDLKISQIIGVPVDGILGGKFFTGLVLDIDYKSKKLTLTRHSEFKLKKKSKYVELDVEINHQKPYLYCTISTQEIENQKVKLLLDTGSSAPLFLFLDTDSILQAPSHFIKGTLGRGLGGELVGYTSLLQNLDIGGDLDFSNLICNYQSLNSPSAAIKELNMRNGLIGNPILSRFRIIIDYTHSKLYLRPERKYGRKFRRELSGLVIYAGGSKLKNYYVKAVAPNSPADKADIQPGDRILRIGKRSTKWLSLQTIYSKLSKKENKTIKLKLLRDGQIIKREITLRDYILAQLISQ